MEKTEIVSDMYVCCFVAVVVKHSRLYGNIIFKEILKSSADWKETWSTARHWLAADLAWCHNALSTLLDRDFSVMLEMSDFAPS